MVAPNITKKVLIQTLSELARGSRVSDLSSFYRQEAAKPAFPLFVLKDFREENLVVVQH